MELPIKHKRGTTVPTAGDLVVGELAINTVTGVVYTKTGAGAVIPISGGGGSWGDILGNLADQTDLQAALDDKYPRYGNPENYQSYLDVANNYYPLNSNPASYATESYVASSFTGYASQAWVIGQNYLTASSLSAYATMSWVNNELASYATASALSSYLSKAGNLAGLTDLEVARSNLNLGLYNTPVFGGLDIQGSGVNVAHLAPTALSLTHTTNGTLSLSPSSGITFPDGSTQSTAATTVNLSGYATENFVTSRGYITSSALAGYATESWVLGKGYLVNGDNGTVPSAGTTGQVLTKASNSNYSFAWQTPVVGDRYLTTSTTSNTVSNGNKTFTVGTGLSYTPTQDITIVYNAANHMHGTVTTYNSTTGVLVVDVSNHTGAGTYTAWTVNVGGTVPVATTLAWGNITGTLAAQVDLQNALNERASIYSPTFYQGVSLNGGNFLSYRIDPAGIGNNPGGWQAYARLETSEFGGGVSGWATHYIADPGGSYLIEQTQSWAVNSQGASFTANNGASWYLKEDGIRFANGTLQSTAVNGSLYAEKSGAIFTGSVAVDTSSTYPFRVTPSTNRNIGTHIGNHIRVGNDPAFGGTYSPRSFVTDQEIYTTSAQGQSAGFHTSNTLAFAPVMRLVDPGSNVTEVRAGRIYYNNAELYASASLLSGYALLSGATFTGKVNLTSSLNTPSLNLGAQVASSPTGAVNGDIWITNAAAPKLAYKTGGVSYYAVVANAFNTFSGGVAVTGSSVSNPQLAVTQTGQGVAMQITTQGAGHALVVEDATSPDTTSTVIDANGNVGIGVNPTAGAWTATQKLEINGYATSFTAAINDSSTKLATTAHVKSVVNGGIGTITSDGWALGTGNYNAVIKIVNGSTSGEIIVPTGSSGASIGYQLVFIQTESMSVSFATDGGGVVLNSFGNKFTTGGQYAVCTLIKTGADEWYLAGNLV
jgi:hypothetical protein